MRRQYHIRSGDGGNRIWDIHRLIELAQNLPVVNVPIAEIAELDEAFWHGGTDDVPTVRSIADHATLIEATDLNHPIILCPQGRVMDGMHRVAKAYLAGRRTILAKCFATMPEPDHIGVSLHSLDYSE